MRTLVVEDEYTPREHGLLTGEWAVSARQSGMRVADKSDIDPVAAAAEEPPRIAEWVRDQIIDAGMRERLAESENPDAESAFWKDFGTACGRTSSGSSSECRTDPCQ